MVRAGFGFAFEGDDGLVDGLILGVKLPRKHIPMASLITSFVRVIFIPEIPCGLSAGSLTKRVLF